MFETMFFFCVQLFLTPGQCYARQTSEGTFLGAGKVCFYVFMFLCEKNCACGHPLRALDEW
jgi:hypothetical protein